MKYVIGGIVILVIIFIIISNSLNKKKINVERAWSNIDTFLQQRLDEMEALYAQLLTAFDTESEMFKEVARLRSMVGDAKSSSTPNEVLSAYNTSSSFLRGFHVENYPELRSMEQSIYTAGRTSTLETNINAARRVFNNNVSNYNLAIVNFPTSLFAKMLGHQQVLLFEADERAQSRPKMASEDYINKKYQDKLK
ncbi:MAG: LemA family protein [Tissierellia bacterium]|nr:LemA family protein [Tissierellia bacterium]